MRKFTILLFLSLGMSSVWAQSQQVSIMEFVKVIDNQDEETLYYYENNWQELREVAMEKGYIKGYQLLKVTDDNHTEYDIVLITTFEDRAQYNDAESNFEEIMSMRSGPKFLNDKRPADFRKNVYSTEVEVHLSSKDD
ncbi:hypothetical protein E1176_13455 [Fulvivirga sp. RKSG066]|uniref:hypothetical protein n=1 Tax=Fulvivirga aurantia TaxID=2529383 RepID=UPI0012BC4324|nr:hypothetical protein [Fulvivirga aurantia]MTI22031.1 hypothetical protein [Fulvivirga aurantia]